MLSANISEGVFSLISHLENETQQEGQMVVCVSAFLLEESVWGLMDSKGVERERIWLVSWSLIRALFIQWISGPQQAATGSPAWQRTLAQWGC